MSDSEYSSSNEDDSYDENYVTDAPKILDTRSDDENSTDNDDDDEELSEGGTNDDDFDPSEHDPEDINDDEADYDDESDIEENEEPEAELDTDVDIDDEANDDQDINDDDGDNDEIVEDPEGEIDTEKCSNKKASKDSTILQYNNDNSHMFGNLKWTELKGNDRITEKVLYYYELTRILGERSQMLIRGAEPLIELDSTTENLDPPKIANLEIINKKLPFVIRRYLPGKKYEDVQLDELELVHTITDEFFVDPDIKITN